MARQGQSGGCTAEEGSSRLPIRRMCKRFWLVNSDKRAVFIISGFGGAFTVFHLVQLKMHSILLSKYHQGSA